MYTPLYCEVIFIHLHISTTSGQPLYEQIVEQIRLQVLQGKLRDGDQLPSIRTLARDLQVSIITTKRAYEELEREGILSVSTGRGSFVSAKGIASSRQNQLDDLQAQAEKAAGLAKTLGLSRQQFIDIAAEAYTKHE